MGKRLYIYLHKDSAKADFLSYSSHIAAKTLQPARGELGKEIQMGEFINNGQATTMWHGISSARFVRRCAQATEQEAQAMSYVASLMMAGEVTEEEFNAAETALNAVERRLIESYTGEVKLNRHGQPFGGIHPALELQNDANGVAAKKALEAARAEAVAKQ